MFGQMRNLTDYPWGLSEEQAKKYFDVDSTQDVPPIIEYIRGNPAVNADNWKLGDTIHSNPITVGSPSYYFIDRLSPEAFSTFRDNHKNRERIIVMGSNDGQFRAFSASDGSEKWSFIPPNQLPRLKYIAHCHPRATDCSHLPAGYTLSHHYFVDGPVTVADVWLGAGDGRNKNADDWKTLLVFGRREGGSG